MSGIDIDDDALIEACLERICGDLGMITDRELVCLSLDVKREKARPAGKGKVHISFKIGLQVGAEVGHGCLLVPLSEAQALANYMMMVPDEGVRSKRASSNLDDTTKETMIEVANFVGGATDGALRGLGLTDVKAGSEGCQGVRANVRPALVYEEGDELIIGRAKMKLHDFPAFDALLIWPALEE